MHVEYDSLKTVCSCHLAPTFSKEQTECLDESDVTSVLRIKRTDIQVGQYLHFSFLNSTHKVIIALFLSCKICPNLNAKQTKMSQY